MDLRQLRYLDRVVAAGGFRSAARDLGVSQPTLTTQIKQLEGDMGVLLLDRSRRPVRTTPAGAVVVARARELLSMVTRLDEEIADLAEQQKGRLRLAANQLVAPILPRLIAEFTTVYPHFEVLLRECMSREAPKHVLRGDFDVCLLAVRAGHDYLPRQLQAARLFSFEHVFAAPPGHRLESATLVTLGDLAHERLVLTSGMSGTLLKEACAQAGIAAHIAVETNDAEMVPLLVAQGMGIGFTPDFVLRRVQPHLKSFKARDFSVAGDAVLAWPEDMLERPALKAFVRYVRSQGWPAEDLSAA